MVVSKFAHKCFLQHHHCYGSVLHAWLSYWVLHDTTIHAALYLVVKNLPFKDGIVEVIWGALLFFSSLFSLSTMCS
jgi:G:T-mismatch repair DNA endonuclease (very short patch repair protein)